MWISALIFHQKHVLFSPNCRFSTSRIKPQRGRLKVWNESVVAGLVNTCQAALQGSAASAAATQILRVGKKKISWQKNISIKNSSMICGECGKCGALVLTDAGCGAWIMNYLIFTLLLLPPPAKRVTHMKDQWRLWSITLICASDICRLCLSVRHWRLVDHGVLKHSDGQIYGHRQGARGRPGKNSPWRKQKNGNILIRRLQPRPLLLKDIDWVWKFLLHVCRLW